MRTIRKVGNKVRSFIIHDLSLKNWKWASSRVDWDGAVILRRAMVLKDPSGNYTALKLPSENGHFHIFCLPNLLEGLSLERVNRKPHRKGILGHVFLDSSGRLEWNVGGGDLTIGRGCTFSI